jgi:hypothetical protein
LPTDQRLSERPGPGEILQLRDPALLVRDRESAAVGGREQRGEFIREREPRERVGRESMSRRCCRIERGSIGLLNSLIDVLAVVRIHIRSLRLRCTRGCRLPWQKRGRER